MLPYVLPFCSCPGDYPSYLATSMQKNIPCAAVCSMGDFVSGTVLGSLRGVYFAAQKVGIMKKRILIIILLLFLSCFGWAIFALLSHARKLCSMEDCINICYDIVRKYDEDLAKSPDGEINIEGYYKAMPVQEKMRQSWGKHIIQFVKNGSVRYFAHILD